MLPAGTVDELSVTGQVKRRLFAVAYLVDKSAAIFTGRPPLLSRRYCSTPLPLDIGDDVLLDAHVDPSTWLSTVNSDGWNVENKLSNATILRARGLISYIRDEILEMTLGIGQDVSVDRLTYVILLAVGPGAI